MRYLILALLLIPMMINAESQADELESILMEYEKAFNELTEAQKISEQALNMVMQGLQNHQMGLQYLKGQTDDLETTFDDYEKKSEERIKRQAQEIQTLRTVLIIGGCIAGGGIATAIVIAIIP